MFLRHFGFAYAIQNFQWSVFDVTQQLILSFLSLVPKCKYALSLFGIAVSVVRSHPNRQKIGTKKIFSPNTRFC